MKKHLFETEFRLDELSKKDQMLFINKYIDWGFFESQLDQHIPNKDISKGGRLTYSKLLLLKLFSFNSTTNSAMKLRSTR